MPKYQVRGEIVYPYNGPIYEAADQKDALRKAKYNLPLGPIESYVANEEPIIRIHSMHRIRILKAVDAKTLAVRDYEKSCALSLRYYVGKILKHEVDAKSSYGELATEYGMGYMMYADALWKRFNANGKTSLFFDSADDMHYWTSYKEDSHAHQ